MAVPTDLIIYSFRFERSDVKAFSSSISTTSLLNHVETDHKISISSKSVGESTKSLHDYFATERTMPPSLSKSVVKFILIRDLVLLCCRDLLPFSLVDGQGLRDFLEVRFSIFFLFLSFSSVN